MRVLAPAKINLHLRVGPRRGDGFHPLSTWMVTIGLFDILVFERTRGEGIALSCDRDFIPIDESNLILRAARSLAAQQAQRKEGSALGGAAIQLLKRIPVGAGLGGGSSDAARTLVALNHLWQVGMSMSTLDTLAADLGSDVGFFLHQPSADCRGRGEQVIPIAPPRPRAAVLICPPFGLATPEVYRAFDRLELGDTSAVDAIPDWPEWSNRSAEHLLPLLANDLEPAAFAVKPDLGNLRDQLEDAMRRIVRMSGSGSSLFTLYDSMAEATAAAEHLQRDFPHVSAAAVAVCPPLTDDLPAAPAVDAPN